MKKLLAIASWQKAWSFISYPNEEFNNENKIFFWFY
jgi:hypothetical protein